MSSLFLIRHGQAGLRHSYDSLSELGRRQSRLLGQYFAAQGMQFKDIYCGSLRRQQESAEEACRACRDAGLIQPEPVVDTSWNEFDLDQVYEDLAPLLSASDQAFRRDYEQMRQLLADHDSAIHRTWSACDIAVVRAWVEGLHPTTEPWRSFQDRVWGAWENLARYGSGEAIAVFTSATPIAVWVGRSLGLFDGHILKLAGVMYNSAISSLRINNCEAALFSFNSVPHLSRPELRTFR